jgi:hypothetical protein
MLIFHSVVPPSHARDWQRNGHFNDRALGLYLSVQLVTITKLGAQLTPKLFSNMESSSRAILFGVAMMIILLALVNQHDSAESIIVAGSETSMALYDVTWKDENRPDLSQWEGCTIEPISSRQPRRLKPFWVPMYPYSDENIIGNLILLLTGTPRTAHKNFYARGRGFKKCAKGNTVTITCEQFHPVVGISPPPENLSGHYQAKILMGMRNPLTGIPAHHHTKATLYHGATTQVEIDEWRHFRDMYFMSTVKDQWRAVLTTWKEMKGYDHTPMYLPLEHLVDPAKGPALTEQLANELRAAGYSVTTNPACAWYKAVKSKLSGQYHPHYDYVRTYIPSLTEAQKVQLVDELNDIRTMYGTGDSLLDQLLAEYIDTIQRDKRNDTPWVNRTISSTKNGGR